MLKQCDWELKQLSSLTAIKYKILQESHSSLPVEFDEKLRDPPKQINPQASSHQRNPIPHVLQVQRCSHDLIFTAKTKRKGSVLSNSNRKVVLGWMMARVLRSRRTSLLLLPTTHLSSY